MKFVVDECTGPAVASWLKSCGHEVYSIYDRSRGITDEQVIQIAREEGRILITNDKDFGELVYRHHQQHCGVILLRLEDERSVSKINVLSRLLDLYSNKIADSFLVVTEQHVRFAKR